MLKTREWQFLGFSVRGHWGFAGLVHLRKESPVTVLYGVNGAGKTRLLDLLSRAIRGECVDQDEADERVSRRDDVLDVHVRLGLDEDGEPAPTRRDDRALRNTIVEAIRKTGETPSRDDLPGLLTELVEARARRSTGDNSDLDHLTPVRYKALLEAAARGQLTFRASGTNSRPWWEVYISVTPETPAQRDAQAEARAWVERRLELVPKDEGWTAHQRSPAAPPLEAWPYLARSADASDAPPAIPLLVVGTVRAAVYEKLYSPARSAPVWQVGGGLELSAIYPIDGQTTSAAELTSRFLLDWVPTDDWSATGPSEDLATYIDEIRSTAKKLFATLFPADADLDFYMGAPHEWVIQEAPQWRINGLPLDACPSSHARWATVCIGLALNGQGLTLIDEPELGLHRLLERRLGAALVEVAGESGWAIVATHSPNLLTSPMVQPHLVTRGNDGISVRPARPSVVDGNAIHDSAAELGLALGDLWSMARLVVVVEGIHDEFVFKSLLRDSLDQSLASLFAMHGGARLRSLADAQLLVRGTDAPVLVVLDDLDATLVRPHLERVRTAMAAADHSEVEQAMTDFRQARGDSDSMLFIHQLVNEAVILQCLDRLHIYGLSMPDVICYLPETEVLGSSTSWSEVLDRWRLAAAPNSPKNLKKWLANEKLIPKEVREVDELIERAAMHAAMRQVPIHADLVGLGLELRAIVGQA